MPKAVVTHSVTRIAVSADRGLTAEVVYWVRNNAEQFLEVRLPVGGSMVSDIYVDGQPQQPMQRADSDDVLIRLPSGDAVRDRDLPVRFVFDMPSPNPGKNMGWFGSIQVPVPELLNVEVMESQMTLHLPGRLPLPPVQGPDAAPAGRARLAGPAGEFV